MLRPLTFIALFVAFMRAQKPDDNSLLPKVDRQKFSDNSQELSRKSKFLPLVQFVSFQNSPCLAKSGWVGTCYSKRECDEFLGEASGDCARGYGVCCIVRASCGSVISINNTHFQNPEYPSGYSSSGICSVELDYPKDTVQVKLEFKSFNILGPVDGDCGNDTFIVTRVNPGSTIPVLCGVNSGQHVFLEVSNAREPLKLTFSTSDVAFDRKWNIKISFLNDYDACKAPPRCLQYFTDVSGTISSFNYKGMPNMLLNDQSYAICFGYNADFCDIGLTFPNIDIGEASDTNCLFDYLAIAGEKLCGTQQDRTLQANATGPIIIMVISDEDNSDEQEGFMINYTQLPCIN